MKPESIVFDDVRARPVRARGVRGPQDARWYWRVELHRKVVWVGWGTREEVKQRVSELIATDSLDVERDGGDAPVEIVSVRDLLECWLPLFRRRGRAERTVVSYLGAAKRLARSGLGITRVKSLRPRVALVALQAWLDEARTKYSDQTVALDLQVLRTAWRWGQTIGAVEYDLPKIELGKLRPARSKYTPTRREVRAVLDAIQSSAPGWAGRLMEAQIATGARVGELADLTWAQVYADTCTIQLNGKTGERNVQIPPHLMETLLEHRTDRPWVFGVTPSSARGVWKYLRRACDEAQVRPWTTHALRRLAVDRLARSGVDVATAAAILGHSVAVMLQLYRTVTDDDQRRAMATARLWDLGTDDNVIQLPAAHNSAHGSGEDQGRT